MLFGKRKRIVKRILIVEDEPLTAFDNETMLTDLGYEVVGTVDDFDRAVALLDPQNVDLVLTDLRLTGSRTGLDLARAARNKGVPVLLSTGYNIPDEARALVLGWLQKPYSERQLRNALDAVDRMLAGEKTKPGRGFELFAIEQERPRSAEG
jgi:DNA-binding response OmpR family regulator